MHNTTKDMLGMSRAARNWMDRRSKIDYAGLIGSIPIRARSIMVEVVSILTLLYEYLRKRQWF